MIRTLLPSLLAACLAFTPVAAQEAPWRHGSALLDEPKYPQGFPHFDYVNPNAPKGGLVRLGALGTFDSFNIVVAGVKGSPEQGLGLIYETLTTSALDEANASYGLLAESFSYPGDYSFVSFRLRPEARWHDGRPVTADDVIFSFESLKANSPTYAFYYANVSKAEKVGEREVRFTFDEKGNRELPQIMGQLMVLPKHWWEGTAPDGRKRDVTQTTLEPPLGSGPYRLKSFDTGRNASYERMKEYWGEKINVNVGQNNFDEIRYEYYRDATVLLEAFKSDRLDFRTENSARNWAVGYDFPARQEGRVILEEFPFRATGVMQAFVLNMRRDKFKDQRVRRAFNLAFPFEELNKTIFYGLYERPSSYFYGLDLASSGLPEGKELEILESVRDKIPASVFTTPYKNPVNDSPETIRNNLREADRLLKEAGWEVKNGRRVNAKGEVLSAELLSSSPNEERVFLPYKASLDRLGIATTVRTVDDVQYTNRTRAFDFDVATGLWPQSLSPGNEQREFWGSQAATREGSRNLPGIADPGVDALIDKVIFAKDRDELVAATKALDRILLAHDYVVPQWTSLKQRTARWNRYGHPETMPRYGGAAFPTIWWYDEAKAAKTGAPR
ncbi:ABC transporter substrate-binding protein [Microvirga sp. 3-52]|uniref:extracellular solute-binding protein n=1 Tax=Microvirga sp. 3-52 TaxID=2792425 RepID=UPI001AC0FA72|nr:extracellular solute-binding protein [Microvirga sp. 3-52]MBO1905552.1 ABC transporter substrate-binding protein [Microvirga sp. 3-52]MBS7452716.1 ABC transporter substrate-binding protein [Microvirga sp. 3-52]